jgi:hypothetical protein
MRRLHSTSDARSCGLARDRAETSIGGAQEDIVREWAGKAASLQPVLGAGILMMTLVAGALAYFGWCGSMKCLDLPKPAPANGPNVKKRTKEELQAFLDNCPLLVSMSGRFGKFLIRTGRDGKMRACDLPVRSEKPPSPRQLRNPVFECGSWQWFIWLHRSGSCVS